MRMFGRLSGTLFTWFAFSPSVGDKSGGGEGVLLMGLKFDAGQIVSARFTQE